MIIQWKGKIGYGDIVSPLCYASNQSEIHDKSVGLNFIWPTFNQMLLDNYHNVGKVEKLINNPRVFVEHSINNDISFKHTNFNVRSKDPKHIGHNICFPEIADNKKDLIVVSGTLRNNKPLANYGVDKKWKDPLTSEQWSDLVKRYNAVYVDYRTPFDELVDILSKTYYFIGYHGSCSWMARLFGCPMTVLSSRDVITSWCFPWSNRHVDDIDADRLRSIELLQQVKIDRNEYIEHLRRTRSERTSSI